MDEYLYDSIDEVLNDSETDPHFSAVAVSNMIKCYIEIEKQLGTKLPYADVKTYFEFCAYTEDEYKLFETRRRKESEYYSDIQY